MQATCPHCGKDIEFLSPRELRDEFGINSNKSQYAKSKGRFPEPWISFNNRDLYLREDITLYASRGSAEAVEKAVETLKTRLSPEELKKVLTELRKS
jgi:hypothetical protein